MPKKKPDTPQPEFFWENLYQAKDTGWDIGGPAPPFLNLLKSPPNWLSPGKIIVPGCGKGHDAALFADHAFQVTGADIAPTAARTSGKKYGHPSKGHGTLEFITQDIFNPLPQWESNFDYWVEHVFFCAIPPAQRTQYFQTSARILKPGGILFGLFYRFDPPDDKEGPPFCISENEFFSKFKKNFEKISFETPANSIPQRKGRERFVVLRKK